MANIINALFSISPMLCGALYNALHNVCTVYIHERATDADIRVHVYFISPGEAGVAAAVTGSGERRPHPQTKGPRNNASECTLNVHVHCMYMYKDEAHTKCTFVCVA